MSYSFSRSIIRWPFACRADIYVVCFIAMLAHLFSLQVIRSVCLLVRAMADNDDLLDYEDEEQPEQAVVDGSGDGVAKKEVKGTYVSIHSSGFRDFLLKPEILRAIVDCGFEHPSEGSVISQSHLPDGCLKVFCMFNPYFLFQCNTNVSLRLFWAWTFCVKPSLVWERQLYLSWPHCSSWNLLKIKFTSLSCVILEN